MASHGWLAPVREVLLRYTRFVLVFATAGILAGCSGQPSRNAPAAEPGATPAAPAGELAPSHAPAVASPEGAAAASTPASQVTSVADVWANRKALAGKTVTVKGKVVKFNGGILGRNWLHLQDGTGRAEDRTNDLTATTSDEAKVGDLVTVTGVVGVDRDFTAGYAYPVILENARIAGK